jgi:hypothetical protein
MLFPIAGTIGFASIPIYLFIDPRFVTDRHLMQAVAAIAFVSVSLILRSRLKIYSLAPPLLTNTELPSETQLIRRFRIGVVVYVVMSLVAVFLVHKAVPLS